MNLIMAIVALCSAETNKAACQKELIKCVAKETKPSDSENAAYGQLLACYIVKSPK